MGVTVDVWTTTRECHECGADTIVWYPPAVGSYAGGDWEPVGEHLAEEPDSPIERLYSDVQEKDVWGNACDECGAYQGNFYVHRDAMREAGINAEVTNPEYDRFQVELPIECSACGRIPDDDDEMNVRIGICTDCY